MVIKIFNKKNTFFKVAVITTSLGLLMPSMGWTFNPSKLANYHMTPLIVLGGKAINIPATLGKIIQTHQGGSKTVICIQDLHCNYEVQMNIAGLIQHLRKRYDLKLVGQEGAFDRITSKSISSFPVSLIREQVLDYFVRQGRLTGADYVAALNSDEIILEGIEDRQRYDESQTLVRDFLNTETMGMLADIQERLNHIKLQIYNDKLLALNELRRAYLSGKTQLLSYVLNLQKMADRSSIPLKNFPSLNQFLQRHQENGHNPVDVDLLMSEIKSITSLLKARLITTEQEKDLDRQYFQFEILEKLLAISVSREELEYFRLHRDQFRVNNLIGFFQKYEKAYDSYDNQLLPLNHYLAMAERFYELADERSVVFVNELLSKMDNYKQTLAVMINGGFHSQEVMELLKEKGINTMLIKPTLTKQDIINPYFELLQGRQTRLERLLKKNQTIMAIENAWYSSTFKQEIIIAIENLIALYQRGELKLKADSSVNLAIKQWKISNSRYSLIELSENEKNSYPIRQDMVYWSNLENEHDARTILVIVPKTLYDRIDSQHLNLIDTQIMDKWVFVHCADMTSMVALDQQLTWLTSQEHFDWSKFLEPFRLTVNWIIGHLRGTTPFLQTAITNLTKFYHPTAVSPFEIRKRINVLIQQQQVLDKTTIVTSASQQLITAPLPAGAWKNQQGNFLLDIFSYIIALGLVGLTGLSFYLVGLDIPTLVFGTMAVMFIVVKLIYMNVHSKEKKRRCQVFS